MLRNYEDRYSHGDFGRYTYCACRCPACTEANRLHSREYRATKKRRQETLARTQALHPDRPAREAKVVPTRARRQG